jgi:hypothetical protein
VQINKFPSHEEKLDDEFSLEEKEEKLQMEAIHELTPESSSRSTFISNTSRVDNIWVITYLWLYFFTDTCISKVII